MKNGRDGDEKPVPQATPRLDSWKEIATYLRRDVRTVQRWERAAKLPVRRLLHSKRGSVHAYQSELDAWWAGREAELARPSTLRWLRRPGAVAAALIVTALGAGTAMLWKHRGGPTVAGAEPATLDVPRILADITSEGGEVRRFSVPPGAHELAFTPDGRELWISTTSRGIEEVRAIDATDHRLLWSMRLSRAWPMRMSRDGRHVYVGEGGGRVLAIDTRTKATREFVTAVVHLRDFALTRDGATLYVAAEHAGLIAIDTATGRVRSISRLPCPTFLALSPNDERLYVNYQCGGPGGRAGGHDAIDVVDARTSASVGPITGLINIGGEIAVTPDNSQIWAGGYDACVSAHSDQVGCPAVPAAIANVLRTTDRALLKTLAFGQPEDSSFYLAFTPDGQRAIADGARTTTVFSTATLKSLEAAPLVGWGHPAFAPDGRTMYLPIGDMSSVIVAPVRRAPAPPAGLTARWTADGTASDAADGLDGESQGHVTYVPGRLGQAWAFDGSSSVRVVRTGPLDDVGSFSVIAWVKFAPSSMDAMTLIAKMTATGDQDGWRLVRRADLRLMGCVGGGPRDGCALDSVGTAVTSRSAMAEGRWYHVAFVRSGDTAALYVDGREEGRVRLGSVRNALATQLRFGLDEHDRAPLRGLIDEVEVYNRALTPVEIAARIAAVR